ncbi:MAG: DUF3800 domain-containing protein [Candidatus Moranbacteria bacterium]|nr:DUF3800 domain-containing protein [Candidatus Moranbacteria bacterium]
MYVMYLDETGDHSLVTIDPQYPIFCLAGCIFDLEYYTSIASPGIDQVKRTHFGTDAVVFHSYEIRKQKNAFNVLRDLAKRVSFYNDLDQIMGGLDYTIIASCIRKQSLANMYSDPNNPYSLSLIFLVERFQKFLEDRGAKGYLSVESRGAVPDAYLLKVFDECRNHGTRFCQGADIRNRITKIEFVTKAQNENGHQIADLVAYPIARYGLHPKRANPAFNILKDKFRRNGTRIRGYGYKEFP